MESTLAGWGQYFVFRYQGGGSVLGDHEAGVESAVLDQKGPEGR